MFLEREQQIEFIRSDLMGPARSILEAPDKVQVNNSFEFALPEKCPRGIPLFWKPNEETPWQEILHFQEESPFQKYGVGLLFADGVNRSSSGPSANEASALEHSLAEEVELTAVSEDVSENGALTNPEEVGVDASEGIEFDISNTDQFKPSTMGISFCLDKMKGSIEFVVPPEVKFCWQEAVDEPFLVNGFYRTGVKNVTDKSGNQTQRRAWLRMPATDSSTRKLIDLEKLRDERKQTFVLKVADSAPVTLKAQLYARQAQGKWVVTAVLRNFVSRPENMSDRDLLNRTLFQSYFEIRFPDTAPSPYPESIRPFDELDEEEQSLALLYSDTATWAVGHSCSAGWDSESGETPRCLYADFLPATELPSMTPDITDAEGVPLTISMSKLASAPSEGLENLSSLVDLYENWIQQQRLQVPSLNPRYTEIANRNIDRCETCLRRMKEGLEVLKSNQTALKSFQVANQAMYLQQLATKRVEHRPLYWNSAYVGPIPPKDPSKSNPEKLLTEEISDLGNWRAFQIAFFLMSIQGLVNETDSDDRGIVDLIWFPTGGGKTEAYLGVAAFYMVMQRLLMNSDDEHELPRDGTSVFMRYTLRMLTTQQFQRAASLIVALEHIRAKEKEKEKGQSSLGDRRFSLGLWIGSDGAPNKVDDAHSRVQKYFRANGEHGNPLVLTECPWCRSEIGFLAEDPRPRKKGSKPWNRVGHAGFGQDARGKQVVLKCSDDECEFGGEFGSIPVEVIDERIYASPPTLVIGTADKFAMLAYRPQAGSLFGRDQSREGPVGLARRPPGLILQDEFHLISGPLGTLYGLYETAIEELCTVETNAGQRIKPKIIASTATIRGAEQQVSSVYGRDQLQLFPSPGLKMSDSFFGRYQRKPNGKLASGRLYLGIQATNYRSFLTTQVRLFTASIFRTALFPDGQKDPWWTLLCFYNSLRELGGGRTLFTSDIDSRLNNYNYRYELPKAIARHANRVNELTSRRTQAELVAAMDELAKKWTAENPGIDACLASNIIEVGVDIDRLALMAIVGQPKSTAQYIQVTGRVGRRWWERPGLILSMYNPAKSRDQSHFEQFHSYHRRLYEQVEPTSATPFSIEAIHRGAVGAFILWARQHYRTGRPGGEFASYAPHITYIKEVMSERVQKVIKNDDQRSRVIDAIEKAFSTLTSKWERNPQEWEEYPHKPDGEYLLLWPGQAASDLQRAKGCLVPTSMRTVDGSVYMQITDLYVDAAEEI
ncbi:Helicase conserved C-terminal domain-containing protein [Marinobacter sp. DSM 26671]|uniref:helicase-related protein n=1 Tax=Marinobacter sp. DSM 26671 TaxID=1761793 RepID=UPI0008E47178|nr:helicase-related protein [Marinobacter sp. DSM 26671]SFE64034.1 Helicase conserved C-terminal domain-containing protein [Marinobacter sp. DSM 26671]